jgi:hypothetical protein
MSAPDSVLKLDFEPPDSDITRHSYDLRCRHGADIVEREMIDAGEDHEARR